MEEKDGRSRRTYKEETVAQISNNLRPTSTSLINEQHAEKLRNNSNDRTDTLVLERIIGSNTHLLEDGRTEVLNSANASHLCSSLDRTSQKETSEA